MRMVKRFGLALGLATLLAASVSADVPSFNCPNGAGGFCVGTGGASSVLSIVTAGLERMSISSTGVVSFPNGTLSLPASTGISFGAFGSINAQSDGVFELLNNAGTSFGRLQFGGTTASFPAIKRNSAALNFRLADDSADAAITAAGVTASAASSFTGGVTVSTGGLTVSAGGIVNSGNANIASANGVISFNTRTAFTAPADGQLSIQNNAQTITIGLSQANMVTAPTDSTAVDQGSLTRFRSSSTISPATGGVGNCGAAFQAAALTADCTIATLPAGQKLVAVYADVTAGFTCSATCTGTKVVQAGTAAGGTQVLAAGLNVAVTGTFGLADADLGSGMTRAAAIQGGLIGSWTGTTIISARFTSGTGNWGTGAATNVNAGTIKFTLITEQIK